ncbi:putative ribonuclease [Bacillus clarus]|uniref:Putative ribonuclease n=1 Tax=Bacillus clarus TaxID=2338372 RepID=A0A090YBW3_9BACI|nr:putative ribonuclease [Bacillus clarus]
MEAKKEEDDKRKADEQKKLEEQQKAEEQKRLEEQRKQEEAKKQEQQKTAINTDKSTYEYELKTKIDAMIKECDEIWNQEWRSIWGEASKDPASVDQNALKEKMEAVSNRYDELSKKNIAFKDGEKLSDPVLKEKMEKFRVEFGLATNYRSNAGRAVTQGLKGLAPMKGRMEESQNPLNFQIKS